MNRPPKKKKKRIVQAYATAVAPINDAFEEKQKTYELTATVLDEYAASGLPGLPGLDLEIFEDDPTDDPPGDNHPFQRRLDNAASAPAAAEATYWVMLLIYRRATLWYEEASALSPINVTCEGVAETDNTAPRRTKFLPGDI